MKKSLSFGISILGWAALCIYLGPEECKNRWELILVAFAAVELSPMALRVIKETVPAWYLLIAVSFALTLVLEGPWWIAVPYLLFSGWKLWTRFVSLLSNPDRALSDWVKLFALGYWTTGAVWALFHLLDFRPFAFDPVIVSLTAAHFHLAGFVVSSIVYALLIDGGGGAKSGLLGWFSLIGMPLVALGITLTRLGYVPFWEQFSALFFLFYTILLLSQLVSFVRIQGRAKGVRILVLGATFSLSLGIFLAMLYAIRFQLPVAWVTIPNMKYWHGSLNAIGFGWLALSAFSGLTER